MSVTPIEAGKTKVFPCPSLYLSDTLTRTGFKQPSKVDENRSFFHAILQAYTKEYVHKNSEGKEKLVDILISSVRSKIFNFAWLDSSITVVVHEPVKDNMSVFLSEFYDYIQESKKPEDKHTKSIITEVARDSKKKTEYGLLCDIFPLTSLLSTLEKAWESVREIPVEKVSRDLSQYFSDALSSILEPLSGIDEKHQNFFHNHLSNLLISVLNQAIQVVHKKFLKSLATTAVRVDQFLVEIISDKINRDLYFIDAETKSASTIYENHKFWKKRKGIILLYFKNNTFEVVGKLLKENKIQRQFEHSDPILTSIRGSVNDNDLDRVVW